MKGKITVLLIFSLLFGIFLACLPAQVALAEGEEAQVAQAANPDGSSTHKIVIFFTGPHVKEKHPTPPTDLLVQAAVLENIDGSGETITKRDDEALEAFSMPAVTWDTPIAATEKDVLIYEATVELPAYTENGKTYKVKSAEFFTKYNQYGPNAEQQYESAGLYFTSKRWTTPSTLNGLADGYTYTGTSKNIEQLYESIPIPKVTFRFIHDGKTQPPFADVKYRVSWSEDKGPWLHRKYHWDLTEYNDDPTFAGGQISWGLQNITGIPNAITTADAKTFLANFPNARYEYCYDESGKLALNANGEPIIRHEPIKRFYVADYNINLERTFLADYNFEAEDLPGYKKTVAGNIGDPSIIVTYEALPDVADMCHLTFDPANGSWPDGSTEPKLYPVKIGETFTIPAGPTLDGHNFAYWEGSFYHPGDSYTVEGDHTFIARYEEYPEIIVNVPVDLESTNTITIPLDGPAATTPQTTVTVLQNDPRSLPATGSAQSSSLMIASLASALLGILLQHTR